MGYFKIMFSTDTESFDNSVEPGMFAYQVANILRQVNWDLGQGLDAGDLRDFMGNTVGRWERNGDARK